MGHFTAPLRFKHWDQTFTLRSSALEISQTGIWRSPQRITLAWWKIEVFHADVTSSLTVSKWMWFPGRSIPGGWVSKASYAMSRTRAKSRDVSLQHSETGTAAFAAKDGLVLRIGIMVSFVFFSFTVSLFLQWKLQLLISRILRHTQKTDRLSPRHLEMLRIAQDFYEALGISYRRSHRQVPAVGCVNQPKFMGISWHIMGCNLVLYCRFHICFLNWNGSNMINM